MNLTELQNAFSLIYGVGEEAIYFAPSRVNLIGEHTDYNGGFVFPAALTFGTYCLIRKNNRKSFRIQSLNQSEKYDIEIAAVTTPLAKGEWGNYVVGVLAQFVKNQHIFDCGADILFWGDVPQGAGLSSSAALEIVTALAISKTYSFQESRLELIKYSQKAEHEFVGVMCGIMDQFTSLMGKKDCAIFLNCNSLNYELVPIKLDGTKIIISNTNSPHRLDAGKYNQRVRECKQALNIIQQKKRIKVLADITLEELNNMAPLFFDKVIFKRALHVISEIERTKKAVLSLQQNDILSFGDLMNQSHDSLRDNYEVTGFELDTMVNEARKINGVIGTRMTGGGFGGSTISLVEETKVNDFIRQVGREYQLKTGLTPNFYVADIGDGAHEIRLRS